MNPSRIVEAAIIEASARHDVPEAEIRAYDRRPHVVAARHDAWRMANAQGVAMAEIGRVTGRDHTTVLWAIRKVAAK